MLNKAYLSNVRQEVLSDIMLKAISMKESSESYYAEFFESERKNLDSVKDAIRDSYSIEELYINLHKVNTKFATDIQSRAAKKLLDSTNNYSKDELLEEYPNWMVGYVQTVFDTKEDTVRKINNKIRKEAFESCNDYDELEQMLMASLGI